MPLHVTTLTLVLIAVDRHRKIVHPMRSRFPSLTCCVGIWLFALLVVMPYPIYTTYLDLGVSSAFSGTLYSPRDSCQYKALIFCVLSSNLYHHAASLNNLQQRKIGAVYFVLGSPVT